MPAQYAVCSVITHGALVTRRLTGTNPGLKVVTQVQATLLDHLGLMLPSPPAALALMGAHGKEAHPANFTSHPVYACTRLR